jgi:hypothetical protein
MSAYGKLLYYRLRQTDTDGTYTFSEIRVVRSEGLLSDPALYPNPCDGRFTVAWDEAPAEAVQLEVFDASGRRIPFRSAHQGNLATDLELVDGVPGLYTFRATRAGQVLANQLFVVH